MRITTSRAAIGLVLASALTSACGGNRGEGQALGPAPTSKAAMAPEVLIFLPYAEDDGRITEKGRDAAVAAAWQKVSAGHEQLGLLELREGLRQVEGGSAGFFSPLEFDPQGSGRVDRAKFAHALDVRFARLDRDQDGVIEPKERAPLPRNETFQEKQQTPEYSGQDIGTSSHW